MLFHLTYYLKIVVSEIIINLYRIEKNLVDFVHTIGAFNANRSYTYLGIMIEVLCLRSFYILST